jgi:hypothetical protein
MNGLACPAATFYFGAITASLSAILFIIFITMILKVGSK